MKDQELINFVNWLMKNQESPKGSSFEETVSWINDLSASDEGRQMLNQLINTYKESHMNNLFKEGGKLQHLLCLKSGGKGPGCGCKKAEDGTIMPDAQPVLGGQPISKSPVLSQNKYSGKAGDYTFSTNSLHKPVTGDWYQEINTGKGVLGRTYSNGQWNYTKDGNPIGENINLDRLGQIFDSNRTKFLDSRYYEGYTDKTKHIDAYAPGGVMDGDEVAGGKVDGMGLPIQTPKRRKDIVWTNIISNGNTGKAATWITPNGRNQRTEYLMGDNNPDVPGFANDIRVDVKRDPQTGELRQDSVVVNKIAPGIWLPFGLPIKYSADAETVRNAKRRHQTGGVLFAKDGSELGSATYEVKKGDNLIKIARQFGLNSLDEILALNSQIKNPNMIYEGQILNLPKNKMKQNGNLEPSSITNKMPNYDRVAYADLPTSVKEKVDAYSQAIRDHKIKYTDVPALYRQQAYNQSIRDASTEAAPLVLTKALLAPWTIPDTVIRGGLNETRKLLNGKDDSGDYGIGDYFDGNFSWLGKDFQEEHPVADAIINTVTTPVIMTGAENIAARAMDGTLSGTMARASANAKATARTMGVQPESVTVEYTMGKTGGHSYKGPGAGKAHTRGGVNNASYRQVPVSSKVVDPMTFVENPTTSGFTGTGYWHGFPVVLPEQEKPNYVIVEPEKEYTEETIVNKNPWIYNTDTPDVVVPYRPGNETITYVIGQANRGNSPKEQSITKESIKTGKGNPKPGVKVKQGEAVGSTPSGYYSGFGYTYGTEGGPWITYQKGGILNKHKK